MLIAIEGPDGSGKSTLIENLKKVLKGNVLYLSRNGKFNSMLELIIFQGSLQALDELNLYRHIIIDRHPWISEKIYGKVLRNGGILDGYSFDLIKDHLRPCEVIYCDASINAVKKALHSNPQMEGVHKNIETIYEAYSECMSQIKPLFSYDFEAQPDHFELDRIVETLNNEE